MTRAFFQEHSAQKRGDAVRAQQYGYYPFARDVYGRFTDSARQVLSVLASKIADRRGSSAKTECKWLMQQMSVSLYRDNARASINHRYVPLAVADAQIDVDYAPVVNAPNIQSGVLSRPRVAALDDATNRVAEGERF